MLSGRAGLKIVPRFVHINQLTHKKLWASGKLKRENILVVNSNQHGHVAAHIMPERKRKSTEY